jgi:predicted DNA-binding protein
MCVYTPINGAEMKRWNLFLDDELLEKTKKLAAKKRVPAADVVRIALEKYLQAVEAHEKRLAEAANVAG